MELQPVDFSLRAKNQRNVVAAVVSTAGRRKSATGLWWIGFSEGATLGGKAAVSATAWLVAPFRTTGRLFGLWLCSKDEILPGLLFGLRPSGPRRDGDG